MTEHAEAGDVGGGMRARFDHGLGRAPIEGCHRTDRLAQSLRRQPAALGGGGKHAGSDSFRQHQGVAGAGAGIGDDGVGMNGAGDEQAELGFLVDDRMPAGDDDTGLGADRRRALEDTAEGSSPSFSTGQATKLSALSGRAPMA